MPTKPPLLGYDSTQKQEPDRNRWWKVALRIGAGALLGVGSVFTGSMIGSAIHIPFLGIVAPAIVLAALVFVSIRFRRFGYVTGFVLAPFIIGSVVVLLLLIVCGVGGFTKL